MAGPAQAAQDSGNPPLHLWNPGLSGDIDIVIAADGRWIHQGRPLRRQSLVNLFASILRREEDGEYYLVTPVEKWRLRVETLPLLITDIEVSERDTPTQQLRVTTNTQRTYRVDSDHPLYLPKLAGCEEAPAVALPHGLSALFTRTAWYRLGQECDTGPAGAGVYSCGDFYILG